jgi:integrase
MRTLPLVPDFREKLLVVKEEQEGNRMLCGRSYNKEFLGYLCVDEMGNLIKPGYVTTAFPLLLEHNGLRKIRYHDLRHSCASLLLANGVPMKQIQEWLGHRVHKNTQLIKTLILSDFRRLNKFDRGAICRKYWNRFIMVNCAPASALRYA